jgi:hypothetical protein
MFHFSNIAKFTFRGIPRGSLAVGLRPNLYPVVSQLSRNFSNTLFQRYPEQINNPPQSQKLSKSANAKSKAPTVLDNTANLFLLTEIFRGMWVVIEQFFRPPYTIFYPYEKGPLSPRFRGEHALRRYPTDALLVNFVRLFVLHWQLLSKLKSEKMEVAVQHVMILT